MRDEPVVALIARSAGTTYTIVVDGFDDGNARPFTLSVTPPP